MTIFDLLRCGAICLNRPSTLRYGGIGIRLEGFFVIHLIVDGYNLIRQVPALARHEKGSLEAGRNRLITLLASYKKIKRHKISVVFDGVLSLSEYPAPFSERGIQIVFSSEHNSADDLIMRMVGEEKERAMVVSSDEAIVRHARNQGADVIRSKEFYDKLIMAHALEGHEKIDTPEKDRPQHKRWTTYKKGPARRLPKKERRANQRKKKL